MNTEPRITNSYKRNLSHISLHAIVCNELSHHCPSLPVEDLRYPRHLRTAPKGARITDIYRGHMQSSMVLRPAPGHGTQMIAVFILTS